MIAWLIVPAVILGFFLLTAFRGAPYVPTHRRNLKRAFTDVYPLSKKDMLVDIGSGDGVILRYAAMQGARAVGYEINPILVIISRLLNRKFGNQTEVKLADFWLAKLPDETTIVYTFGDTRDIDRIFNKVQDEATRLRRPLYFMSYGFKVKGQKEVKQDDSFQLYKITPGQK